MKTQSAKAKGRKLQNWVRDKLIELLSVHEEDVESRSMGASGEDLIMAQTARSSHILLNVKIKSVLIYGMRINKQIRTLENTNQYYL